MAQGMKHADLKLCVKAVSNTAEDGTFEGLAAVYGNVDLGGDVIEQGAFEKSLKDRADKIPILWQHNSHDPIGIGKLRDSYEGLLIAGELVLESPSARTAYALLKKKAITGLSIGYEVLRDEVHNGVRVLKELKLWEVSLVTFPMNPAALISAVKSTAEFERADVARIDAMFTAARKEMWRK
jgi:uncharacterized protein